MLILGLVVLAYLIGSVPFGLVAGRMKGVDLRKHGSGNVGATNVVRVLGKPIGIAVFFLDFLKGLLPTLLFSSFARRHGATGDPDSLALLFGAAAVLGHVFSVWLRFKGGKGVATSAGLCFGLDWRATLVAFVVWFVVFKITKYVSVASLVSCIAFPVAFIMIARTEAFALACIIVYTHRSNIGRLMRGEEHQFARSVHDRTRDDSR
jgi:glycerol-3-phosphate acyltransferase PlsY